MENATGECTWPLFDYASAAISPRGSFGFVEAPPVSSALSSDTRSSLERLLESLWEGSPGHRSPSEESSAGSGASWPFQGGDFQQPDSPPSATLSFPGQSEGPTDSESVSRPAIVNHYHYHVPQPFDFGRNPAQSPVGELPPTTLHTLLQKLPSIQEPGGLSNRSSAPSLPFDHPMMSLFLPQPVSPPTLLNPKYNPTNGSALGGPTTTDWRVSVSGTLTTQDVRDVPEPGFASQGPLSAPTACPVSTPNRPPKYPPVFSRPHPPRPEKRPGCSQTEPPNKRAKSGTAPWFVNPDSATQFEGKRARNGPPDDAWRVGPFQSSVGDAPGEKAWGAPTGERSVIAAREPHVSGLLMGALNRFVAGPSTFK